MPKSSPNSFHDPWSKEGRIWHICPGNDVPDKDALGNDAPGNDACGDVSFGNDAL